jgi:hypothetical protein
MNSKTKIVLFVILLCLTKQIYAGFDEDARHELSKSSFYECLTGYPCFKLSNSYPKSKPQDTIYPWLQYDFKTDSEKYMEAVFKYVIEGNIEVDWDISKNSVRKWFHAPWMHAGSRGREPIHGLTRERGSRWHELSEFQTRRTNNWAVGFYNAPGGYVFSQVWKDPGFPNSSKAQFPHGTVSAKILFTDATDKEAQFMKSNASLTWDAQIERGAEPKKLRLLQMDIAVRDARADEFTGWLFGTFMFDGNTGGEKYWENIIPVGIHWGNDPNFTSSDYKSGKRPVEGWINPYVKGLFTKRPPFAELGYLGRMNGPVDNPFSSCLGCHGRAVDTAGRRGPAFTPRPADICVGELSKDGNRTYEIIQDCTVDEQRVGQFFRNLKPNEPFMSGTVALDYSLQLADGFANWHIWFKGKYPALYAQKYPQQPTPEVISNKLVVDPMSVTVETPADIPTLPIEKAFGRGDEDL